MTFVVGVADWAWDLGLHRLRMASNYLRTSCMKKWLPERLDAKQGQWYHKLTRKNKFKLYWESLGVSGEQRKLRRKAFKDAEKSEDIMGYEFQNAEAAHPRQQGVVVVERGHRFLVTNFIGAKRHGWVSSVRQG